MSLRICELLNIKYPILQGAMAQISEGNLAAAVSEAGGLGIIAGGNAPADIIEKEIKLARGLTKKPIGLNIMLLSPYADDIVQLAVKEQVEVVTTGAGSPEKYLEKFKENNIKVIPVIPSVALAKRMERIGVDAVIAEGMESGGHIGKLTTMALVPQVSDAVSIPVIAAGGIADGRGMAAAFMLGAGGVQIGTRFLTAKECIIHENYKNAVLKAKDIDTTITGQITGHPVRCLRNRLTKEYEQIEKEEMAKDKPDIERIESYGIGALRRAVIDGDVKHGTLMAGQIAGMVNKENTSKEIIEEIIEEFQALLKNGANLSDF